jgi:hypothetical protein
MISCVCVSMLGGEHVNNSNNELWAGFDEEITSCIIGFLQPHSPFDFLSVN